MSNVQVKARRLKDLKNAYEGRFIEFPINSGVFRGQVVISRRWTRLLRKSKPELKIETTDFTALDAVGSIKILKKEVK